MILWMFISQQSFSTTAGKDSEHLANVRNDFLCRKCIYNDAHLAGAEAIYAILYAGF